MANKIMSVFTNNNVFTLF